MKIQQNINNFVGISEKFQKYSGKIQESTQQSEGMNMQSNQANKQAKVNFKVGDKVKFKEEVCVQFDHDHRKLVF